MNLPYVNPRGLTRMALIPFILVAISSLIGITLYNSFPQISLPSDLPLSREQPNQNANESGKENEQEVQNKNSSKAFASAEELEIKLKASIQRLSKLPYSRERQSELSKVGKQLGNLLGIQRSMEVVSDLFGPGKDRIWMINAVTSGSSEPVGDVLSFARSLGYSDDFHACMVGISMLVQSKEGFSPEELEGISPPLSSDEVRTIANGLSQKGFRSKEELNSRNATTVAFIKANTDRENTENLITEYFSSISSYTPQGSLESWLDASKTLNVTFIESYPQQKILASAFRSNPQNAIEKIEASLIEGDPKIKGRLAASALQQWMQIDGNAAAAWAAKSDMHGAAIKSTAITPLFEQALQSGDLDTAKRWLEMIHDPEIRKRAEVKMSNGLSEK